MDAASDLLAALLAVRNGLLSAPAALECAAMAPEGGGFLAAAQKRGADTGLLRRLMDAQLGRHGGEASKAAAAVGGDAAFRAEVAKRLSAAPAAAPESRPSRYLLGDELGRGGLGRVVSAFDAALDREVAVKLVIDDVTPALLERFSREAKLTARLDHPNVVPVHDFGELTGAGGKRQVFLSMKRIHGRDLGTLLAMIRKGEGSARDSWSRARLLGVFQGVCNGVAYAHSKGIIHRDLKPANVMIGEFGETLVVDWGLAKIVGGGDARGTGRDGQATLVARRPDGSAAVRASGLPPAADITMDGEVLGTPAYMPPEQAEGRLNDMDARSDIWSLGAILFEILTLRAAFDGASAQEVMEKISRYDLAPPSRFTDVPAELDAIVMRAMAKFPGDRYATALQLSHEIQLFLEGAKEKDRARREAKDRAAEGRKALAAFRALRDRIGEQEKAVADLAAKIRAPMGPAEKRPLWDAEDRLRALRNGRMDACSQASFSFSQALAADAGCEEAVDGICELFCERFLEAEQARNREEAVLHRSTLERYDRSRRFLRRLDAPGRLSLRVFAYDCPCLEPVKDWDVKWSLDASMAWRDGAPRPDLERRPSDRAVPRVVVEPKGRVWGHGPGCVPRELRGVRVGVSRYEERERRLVPGEERDLGTAPLAGVELPQGSHLVRLRYRWPDGAETVQPLAVRIDRDATWAQDVTLYHPRHVPEGFAVVPGGPFVFGGRYARGHEEQALSTRDVFVARRNVTAGQYAALIDDRFAGGQEELARDMFPVLAGQIYEVVPGSNPPRVRFKDSGNPQWAHHPDHPIHFVNWEQALLYAAWRSAREGRLYSLLHEEEFEKAARGVDRRIYAHGDAPEPAYFHGFTSLEGEKRVLPVETFPMDESPWGVRGLCGGMQTWCLNAMEGDFSSYRAVRGGSWIRHPDQAAAGQRSGFTPNSTQWEIGLRLCCRPFAWPV